MQGLLDSYASALQVVKLYGPTNFAPVIKHITMQVRARRHEAETCHKTNRQETLTALRRRGSARSAPITSSSSSRMERSLISSRPFPPSSKRRQSPSLSSSLGSVREPSAPSS